MKKISIMAAMLLGVFAFTSCESDRDDNPTLQLPSTFTLLEPEIGTNVVDLLHSESVTLKAQTQPNYGFPTAVKYGVQMSLDNDWTVVEDEDATPHFYEIDATSTSITFDVPAAEIDKGIMILRDYTDAAQVSADPETVYLRMTAQLINDEGGNIAYSNVVTIQADPYYLERKNAEPVYWFLVGSCIGDGTWTSNASAGAYLALFPLSLVPEYEYDPKTGLGEITATFFVPKDAIFKLRQYSNSWDYQWGFDGSNFVKNDGGSGNIVPTDGEGFYTLTYNTLTDKITFEKVDAPAATYSTVTMIGFGGDWETDVDMSPAAGAGENNHMWTAQVTITETTQFKFRANKDWGTNWGYGAEDGEVNLYGFGTNGGHNIGIEPGQYTIYLNDIDGFFRILPVGDAQK